MLANLPFALAVLNALLGLIILWRMHMLSNEQRAAAVENAAAILRSAREQLDKVKTEIIGAINEDGVQSARLDAAVESLGALANGFAPVVQALDDLHPDGPVSTPERSPSTDPTVTGNTQEAAQPPQDDAFVDVGTVRFSDGEIQTEGTKAAAVEAWNAAHPEGPVAS